MCDEWIRRRFTIVWNEALYMRSRR